MQVRAGRAAAHPGLADLLALDHGIAGLDATAVKVAVHADQAVAMIDKDRLAIEKKLIDREDAAGRVCADGGAAWHGDVEAGVR